MEKRPLIGITSGLNDRETYQLICRQFMDALCECGALPVLLPITPDESTLQGYVNTMDGFLFSGGGDVDPMIFGQLPHDACGSITPDRDAHELALMRLILQTKKPVLGVCRGMQIMNIALGGDVYQDLKTDYGKPLIAHRQKQPEQYPSHPVDIAPRTLLHRLVQQDQLMVNSLHHQAVNRLGRGITACAAAPDGVVEAIELTDHPFFLGVQWHPERLWTTDDKSKLMFHAFADACRPGLNRI